LSGHCPTKTFRRDLQPRNAISCGLTFVRPLSFANSGLPCSKELPWCKPHFAACDLLEQDTMTTPTIQPSLALRPREAAKALGISPRLLWQLTHDGHIPCVRVGSGKRRTVLYPTADLQAWLTRQAEAATGGDRDSH
jgi:excisionase family DNA binding protein